MITLHVSPARGRAFESVLEKQEAVIGRSSQADITVKDPYVSRRHARIFLSDEQWKVEDLESRQGTTVNGVEVAEPTPLLSGDVIGMANTVITVVNVRIRGTESDQPVVFRPASDVLLDSKTPLPNSEPGAGESASGNFARIHTLNEIHDALGRSVALDELLELILDRVFDLLKPQQACVFLRTDADEFESVGHRCLPGTPQDLTPSRTLIDEVIGKEMAALVNDAGRDERFSCASGLREAGVQSLVAAPLLDPEGGLGMIVLCSSDTERQFTSGDMELLVSLASVAAMRIRNLSLAEEAAERRRLEKELALAREIQVALLPQDMPKMDGYQLHGGNIPSRLVSGDFYEAVERFDGRECVLMMVDVSGKGIGASLVAQHIEASCFALIEGGYSPQEILTRVSLSLHRRTQPERYATVFLAALEPDSGKLTYVNAGHVPGLVRRVDGDVDALPSRGFPIGLMPEASYEQSSTRLEPGETLILYTDGFTEAENPGEVEFGVDRFSELCSRHGQHEPDRFAHLIEDALDSHVGSGSYVDDRTILIVRRDL
ncbi:MAG: SpoIIE family protein phosphatase [bacterium]|nr:SpoIIE family protein phosphatase [bacterium]